MSAAGDELRWHVGDDWADVALADPEALLADHAHLERAAATNALQLLRRWPDGVLPDRWVASLTAIARDEVEHLAEVNRVLADRGGRLPRRHANPYASALRSAVRNGGPHDLADRLHVSALIELRSHERFVRLAAAGHELSPLYARLQASEAGHHRLFVQLAARAGATAADWDRWLEHEAEVARAQPPGPRIHGGAP